MEFVKIIKSMKQDGECAFQFVLKIQVSPLKSNNVYVMLDIKKLLQDVRNAHKEVFSAVFLINVNAWVKIIS